eukprot:2635251-Pyramimonas_sp.AAC.1
MLVKWLQRLPLWCAHRCLPIVCLDLNSGFGLQRAPGQEEWTAISSQCIGSAAPAVRQRYAADILLPLLEQLDLVPINTFRGGGPTFYSSTGTSSQLDFILVPRCLISAVTSAGPL